MGRGFGHRKALVKTISWRGLSFVFTTFGVWAVTGRLSLAASVGVLEIAVKSVGYYVHECFWESVAHRAISRLPFFAWIGASDGWCIQEPSAIQAEESN